MLPALPLFAVDIKYAPIVSTAIADLKTNTKLSLLQGHAAMNISSGNKELDAQFAAALQEAYPNLTAKQDTVKNEDLYQMAVKIYFEGEEVFVHIVVTNFKQEKIAERTVKPKNVTHSVMETLQYKTALSAKNEFEAYLDSAFSDAGAVVKDIIPMPPKPVKELLPSYASRLWTVGASLGSSFAPPWLIATARFSFAPFSYSFLEAGCDFGFVSGMKKVKYYSFYPFVHYAFFLPFTKSSGWYIGGGVGWQYANYSFPETTWTINYGNGTLYEQFFSEENISVSAFALDIIAGIILLGLFNISYTLKTNFSGISHKASIGFVYRY